MSVTSLVVYRMSDYPDFPNISTFARPPVDVVELKQHLHHMRDVTLAGKQVTFDVYLQEGTDVDPIHIARIDPSMAIEDIVFPISL